MTEPMTPEQPMPFALQSAAHTDSGRTRQANEDRWLIDLENNLFVVCDGLSAQAAGQIAAQAVVEFLPRAILHRFPNDRQTADRLPAPDMIEAGLREAVLQTSRQLLEASADQPGMKGMGTTLALVWMRGATAFLVHVGDSRIYRARGSQITRLTDDHSVVAQMVQRGEIRPELARAHPANGRLTRYIGLEGDAVPDVRAVEICKGDRFLLCTDGLTNVVPDEEIAAVLRVNPNPAPACRALIGLAAAHGGMGNTTALVINAGAKG